MKEIQNDTWYKLLGYDPTKELKIKILAEVETDKLSLEEACARYALPPLYLGDEPEGDYCNSFRPAIRIVTRNTQDK